MNDWYDPENTNYHVKQTQLKRLACLAESLLQELAMRESSASFIDGDKKTWLSGYRRALLDLVESLGEDYLQGAHELYMAALGYSAMLCLERLREGDRKVRKAEATMKDFGAGA